MIVKREGWLQWMENLSLETHTALCEIGMPSRTQKTCSWSLLRSQDRDHGYQASLWHNTPGPLHIQESQNRFEEQFIVGLYLLPPVLVDLLARPQILLGFSSCHNCTNELLPFISCSDAVDLPRYLPMIFRQILSRYSKAAMDICNPSPRKVKVGG